MRSRRRRRSRRCRRRRSSCCCAASPTTRRCRPRAPTCSRRPPRARSTGATAADGRAARRRLGLQPAASSCCLPRRCAPHSTHEPQITSSTTALLLLEVIDGAYEKLTVQTAHAIRRPYTGSYIYIDKTEFQFERFTS
eukprot:scaffold66461_cov64-Phaeocystis_antarctica.AAC.1